MKPYYENEHGQLYHGDCLEVMATLAETRGRGWVDMVLCDPPYGTTQNKWDAVIPFRPMWSSIWCNCKEEAAIVMTAAQPFTSCLGFSGISELRYAWVWEKSAATGHLNAKRMPMKNHEDVLVFYKKQPIYNPQGLLPYGLITRRGGNGGCYGKSGQENIQVSTGYPRTIQKFPSAGKTIHPTQKPIALFVYLIATYTNQDETVLDFCAGSGTTAVAAQQLGRKWVLIEKEENYCEAIAKRLEDPKSFQVKSAAPTINAPAVDETPNLGIRFLTALERIAENLERIAT